MHGATAVPGSVSGAGTVATVTDDEFTEAVLNSDKPVLVEYWATWCGPCRALNPILKELAAEQADQVTVLKMDIDESPVTARNQQIMAAPTMILYVGGSPVASIVGVRSKSALTAAFEPHWS